MSEKDSKLSFAVKKTNELTEEEIDQLIKLHKLTMKQDRTKKMFEEKYLFNFLGFSFHALMIYKNKIVGCNTVIPQEFNFFDKKYIFGQWCETLIDENFRGGFSNFKKLGTIFEEVLLKNNIYFIYGLPNKALYVVSKRLLGMKDITRLNYYVYPKKLNKFLRKYFPLNILLNFLLKLILSFNFRNKTDYNFQIQKIANKDFDRSRFKDKNIYKVLKKNNYKLTYKIDISTNHNNAKIIWIMDVFPLTVSNLKNSVNDLKKEGKDIDLIIYIGKLKSLPHNLLKIPDKFIKENNIVSGKILDESKINSSVFNYENWNLNSSNFDYR